VEVGDRVKSVKPGEKVYAYSMEGGFYAEYAAVKAKDVAKLPKGLSTEKAGALGADGITALRGLEALNLVKGQKLLIFGASGGIGHLAVQLAKRLGLKVFAVASGADGVQLVQTLGADRAADGKHEDLSEALEHFASDGFDGALVLANGRSLDEALSHLKPDAPFAYPHGVEPQPEGREGLRAMGYDGTPGADAFERLNALIEQEPFHLEVRTYSLEDAAQAHRDVERHHLGKLALRMH
jgi:NADPH:quinone reductase-like Zn-dependent oxidoreductase